MQHSDTICDDVCVAPCPLFVYLPFLIESSPLAAQLVDGSEVRRGGRDVSFQVAQCSEM